MSELGRSRWLAASATRLLLAGLSTFAACGRPERDPRPTVPPTSPDGRAGGITLRFVNPTDADVYIDATYGVPHRITGEHGTIAAEPPACGSSCEACECRVCGEPLSTVRRIAPGEGFDVEWGGTEHVRGTCGEGCSCTRERQVEPGTYRVELAGARARAPLAGSPSGDDPDVFVGSLAPGASRCRAVAEVVLGGVASTFEVPFTCEPGHR